MFQSQTGSNKQAPATCFLRSADIRVSLTCMKRDLFFILTWTLLSSGSHWGGGSREGRLCHPWWSSWQSIQVKQDQAGPDLAQRNCWHWLTEGGKLGVPLVTQHLAGFPLNSCQRCLPGTWVRGKESTGWQEGQALLGNSSFSLTSGPLHTWVPWLAVADSISLVGTTLFCASAPSYDLNL